MRTSANHIRTEYCTAWGFVEEAAGLAEHLLHDYQPFLHQGVTMTPSTGGIFMATLNDDLLYSNDGSGYFPTREEIDRALEERLGISDGA